MEQVLPGKAPGQDEVWGAAEARVHPRPAAAARTRPVRARVPGKVRAGAPVRDVVLAGAVEEALEEAGKGIIS